MATDWINNHMNKEISQQIMKNKIIAAGFEIIYFNSFNFHKYNLDFNKEIYCKIKKNYNFLTMNDMLGTSVTFIAKKK